jgi:pimeloyl-ACP methyl ester carboxylesterase
LFFLEERNKELLQYLMGDGAVRILTMVTALLLSHNIFAAETASVLPDRFYLAPQRMVAVDGARRINLICQGAGTPTVILDSGAGGGSMFWRHVQGQIAATTQACTYDRAGYGFSDAATRPSDAANTVDDLHRLLHAAGLPTPIVYVGHSIAGLYGVLFAAKYPAAIAGAVLVDPSFAHQDALLLAALTPAQRAAADAQAAKGLEDMKTCLALSQDGSLAAPQTKAARDCMDASSYPDKFSPELMQELARQWSLPPSNATALSEFSNFSLVGGKTDTDSAELDAAPANFGDKPLIILTHGKQSPPPPGRTPAEVKAGADVWNAGHDRLTTLSSHGSNTLVPDAGHYIQIDQPGVVIDAVRKVVMQVRKSP